MNRRSSDRCTAIGAFPMAAMHGRHRMTIVFLDMVDSVRLIAQDEENVISRWQRFTRDVRSQIVPDHGATIVKSMGDGLVLTFIDAFAAVAAARQLHGLMHRVNDNVPGSEPLVLRIGIHTGDLVADELDIYGHGINLAARIATLAGPGEIVISTDVRDQLSDVVDGDIEDLGKCFVKNLPDPIHVFRIGQPGVRSVLFPCRDYDAPLNPTIAVIPFASRSGEQQFYAIGELIADGVITRLSRTRELKVISGIIGRWVRAE